MQLILLAHSAATLFMVGVIWFVQIVHYPLFAGVGREGFASYSTDHARLTGLVVGPPMLLEMATAIALVLFPPRGVPAALPICGLALLVAVWLSTAFLQSPQHTKLARGFDAPSQRFLVRTNWLRTVLWSVRGVLVLGMVAAVLRAA